MNNINPFFMEILEDIGEKLMEEQHFKIQLLKGRVNGLKRAGEEIDSEWLEIKKKFDKSVAESPSDAWTRTLTGSFELKKEIYDEKKRVNLENLNSAIEKLDKTEFRLSESSVEDTLGFLEINKVKYALNIIQIEVERYKTILIDKKSQYSMISEYGSLRNKKWNKEILRLIEENSAIYNAMNTLKQYTSEHKIFMDWELIISFFIDSSICAEESINGPRNVDGSLDMRFKQNRNR